MSSQDGRTRSYLDDVQKLHTHMCYDSDAEADVVGVSPALLASLCALVIELHDRISSLEKGRRWPLLGSGSGE